MSRPARYSLTKFTCVGEIQSILFKKIIKLFQLGKKNLSFLIILKNNDSKFFKKSIHPKKNLVRLCFNLNAFLIFLFLFFLGIILKPNKRYSQTVQKSFHVSQACLDTSSSNDSEVQVMLTSENENFLLCTLQKGKVNQATLDLNFAEGDVIGFSAKGSGTVHLTGFLVPGDFFGDGPMGSDEEDEDVDAGNVS